MCLKVSILGKYDIYMYYNVLPNKLTHSLTSQFCHCHYSNYLLLQNVHILYINCAFEFIGEMSHLSVPVLYSDPYAKNWGNYNFLVHVRLLKKIHLFAYTHKSKCMLQSFSWSNIVISRWHDGNYLATGLI